MAVQYTVRETSRSAHAQTPPAPTRRIVSGLGKTRRGRKTGRVGFPSRGLEGVTHYPTSRIET